MRGAVGPKGFLDDFAAQRRHAAPARLIVPIPPSEQETALTIQLRREANEEKDAFGWHAFQTLSICSVALGGIFYFMFSKDGFPAVGLGALPILAFALVACRLGDSCYSSANRHYGYELFLYRVRTAGDQATGRWKPEYRNIEWEAAMRAWRVVQASLFEAIYRPGNYLTIDRLRPQFDTRNKALWFCQSSLSKESGATFHAGSYLSRMHAMLLLAAVAAVAILWITPFAVLFKPITFDVKNLPFTHLAGVFGLQISPDPAFVGYLVSVTCLTLAVFAFFALQIRVKAETAKRQIMEDGLLSIHACSVVWQAVIVAHFSTVERAYDCGLTSWKLVELSHLARAKHRREWRLWQSGALRFEDILSLLPEEAKGRKDDGAGISGYTFWLAEEAASLARCASDVPGWIGVGEQELRMRGTIR